MPDLTVKTVELSSRDGLKLATENGILYPPAVFIEGKLFSHGKINADLMVATIRNTNGDSNTRHF